MICQTKDILLSYTPESISTETNGNFSEEFIELRNLYVCFGINNNSLRENCKNNKLCPTIFTSLTSLILMTRLFEKLKFKVLFRDEKRQYLLMCKYATIFDQNRKEWI